MTFGVTVALSLAACGASTDSAPAIALGERYFDALRQGDYKTIDALYSASFFASTPKDRLQRVRDRFREKLGEYRTHELLNTFTNWSKRPGEPDGDYTTLQYKVTYSKGTTKETIVVFAPKGGGDAAISGWDIRWDVSPSQPSDANRGD